MGDGDGVVMKVVGGVEFVDDVIMIGKLVSIVIGSRVMESW